MDNTQSSDKTLFFICESFVKELKEVVKKYPHIEVSPYLAKCKYHNIEQNFEINKEKNYENIFILGGCTVKTEDLPREFNTLKEENCFYMFAPRTMVDHHIKNGGYIVTPGWVKSWEKYIKEFWGFDKKTAIEFFKEFCKKVVFLDTKVDEKAIESLEEFCKFIEQPFEVQSVGLEYFKLYIDNLIQKNQLENIKKTEHKKLDDALRTSANYAMAFDLLSKLNEKLDEKDIIQNIIEIFTMLFAPDNIAYVALEDEKIISKLSSKKIDKEKYETFFSSNNHYALEDEGFDLKLTYDNEVLGIVFVEDIQFKQYITQYLNLAASISGVCALAINNARNYLKTKEIEAQLAQHAKLVSMGEMMGSIAHQWRQPLNGLNINIEMLEEYYEMGEIDEEFIEKFIEKNTATIKFLSNTITDFSDFFRINKQKTHFSIKENIERTISIIATGLNKGEITVNLKGEDIKVFGYPNEFQQVVLNIINNAKDAITDLGINNGTIDIDINKTQDFAKIIIEDNGGGINKDIIDRIFEPYFTTKEQGKGIGMGLYISKMIIEENMDGKLNVSNNENGASFDIRLKLDE